MNTILHYTVNKTINEFAFSTEEKIAMISNCILNGYDINTNNSEIFIKVLYTGNIDLVKFFIRSGIDIHMRNDYALILATNNANVFEILIENGCDLQIRSKEILESAISYSRLDVIRIFMKYNNDYVMNNLNALFHYALNKEKYTIAEFFIGLNESEIDLKYFDCNLFALSGYTRFKKLLLKNGLDPNIESEGLKLMEMTAILNYY